MEGTHRKALMVLLLTGVFMAALDLAIIGPALPAIQADFGMSSRGLAWLFNIYVLFQLTGTPLLAKMSDRYGPRPIYITSISLFAIGSLVIVAAPEDAWMYVGRAIQGFGGAGIFPVAAALIGDIFPPEKRGGALGLLGAVFGIAFLIGPVLGGILLQFSWQWLFLINLPIALALIWGAWKLMPEGTIGKQHKPFDLAGAITLSITLTTLAIAITNFDSAAGLESLLSISVWPFLLCAVTVAPLHWRFEKRAADPIIRPAFFDNPQIVISAAITMGLGAMQSGTVFYTALAVASMGISESHAAWLLVPGILLTTVASPLAGVLINRLGARLLVVFGLVCISSGFMLYGMMNIDVILFVVAGCIAGLGFATSLGAPLRVIVMNAASDADRGAAQGLLNVSVNIGQLLGAAVVGGVAASHGGGTAGYQAAYVVLGCMTALLVMLGIRLKPRSAQ